MNIYRKYEQKLWTVLITKKITAFFANLITNKWNIKITTFKMDGGNSRDAIHAGISVNN